MNDLFWMKEAYILALTANDQGEVPVGAILVDENNQLLGRGWNRVLQTNDPTAHAEILALREAGVQAQNYRLQNTTMYITLEPCCMCAAALVHARIERVVFATRDFKAGAAGSVFNLLQGGALNHKVQIDEGFMQHECSNLLTNFFKERRL